MDSYRLNTRGGVAVYQRNLINYLLENSHHEIYFINSGFTYQRENSTLGIVQNSNPLSDRLKTFEIVNSPVLAPVQQSIINVRHYLEDTSLYLILKQFIERAGGFDVIHFNNLEGLSLSVLKLKEAFPKTKFVYSLHNYFLVCTKVDLFQRKIDSRQNQIEIAGYCKKTSYTACASCYPKRNYNTEILSRKFNDVDMFKVFATIYTQNFPDVDDVNLYREFEERNIFYVNKYIDVAVAVSQRVKDIFLEHGLNERKLRVSYIGTDVAKFQKKENCADINANPFKIIYLGYMSIEKGFYFLLQALYAMPIDMAKNIVVTVASRYNPQGNKREIDALNNLRAKFRDVILLNGYKREELKNLLSSQNLGIVPVLWEDNLPQIAVEQIAYGVPILCSNLGGAAELHNHNSNFTFKAGDVNDFLQKFANILYNRDLLKKYWDSVRLLTTMEEHVNFLEQIYS